MATYNGTDAANSYVGTSAGDLIFGYGGDDILHGQGGNDTIDGGTGDDSITGGDGNDSVIGGYGYDTINGDAGLDTIYGGKGKDYTYSGSGNDTILIDDTLDLNSLSGDDIDGGADFDRIFASSNKSSGTSYTVKIGNVWNVEELFNSSATKTLDIEGHGLIDLSGISTYSTNGGTLGQILGQSGNDTIYGFNFSTFTDTIYGGSGNDVLYGGGGNDFLLGGTGNDTLSGDAGNDELSGSQNNDVFLFRYNANEGNDMINDYVDGVDRIQLSNTGGSVTFSSLTMSNVGSDCLISLASGTTILVKNTSTAVLYSSDFIFT